MTVFVGALEFRVRLDEKREKFFIIDRSGKLSHEVEATMMPQLIDYMGGESTIYVKAEIIDRMFVVHERIRNQNW